MSEDKLKHQIAFDDKGNILTLDIEESKLRLLSSEKKLYLDKDKKYPVTVAGGEHQRLHFRQKTEYIYNGNLKGRYNEGMSEIHLNIQDQIVELLKKHDIICEKEKWLNCKPLQIADNYFEYEGKKYIIEVQKSPQTSARYYERSKGYESLGINYVWITVPYSQSERNTNNFQRARECNKGAEFFITEEDGDFQFIRKINNEGVELKYNPDFSIEELVAWLFEPEYGLTAEQQIFNYDYRLDNLKANISHEINKLNWNIRENNELSAENQKITIVNKELMSEKSELENDLINLKQRKFNLSVEKEKQAKEEYLDYLKSQDNEVQKLKAELENTKKNLQEDIDSQKKLYDSYCSKIDSIKETYKIWYKELDLIKKYHAEIYKVAEDKYGFVNLLLPHKEELRENLKNEM